MSIKRKKIVFVSGNFNILHPGHLRILRFARELGGSLIVGLNSDKIGGDEVHLPQELRRDALKANTWVNEVVIIDQSLEKTILEIKPDIVVKGKEYENQNNIEKAITSQYGGILVFSSGDVAFSSIDLLKNSLLTNTSQKINYPKDYCARHFISKEELLKKVNNFTQVKICVIGDLIIDEYITCEPIGMSQEDPTIVAMPIDKQLYVGGSGIVAAHIAGLGGHVDYISVVGKDKLALFAEQNLRECGVFTHLIKDKNRITTLKQRFRAKGKSLLRLNHFIQSKITVETQKRIIRFLKKNIKKYNLIIFSDFNYGCLPQALVESITNLAMQHSISMIADSQTSSQVGDISRFSNMSLIICTEHEARVSLKNHEDGLVVIAEKLKEKAKAENIVIKLGEEGAMLYISDEGRVETDSIKALNSSPVDTAGAGDSMLAASGLSIAVGEDMWTSILLGAIAAGIQVSRVGNTPLASSEIKEYLL